MKMMLKICGAAAVACLSLTAFADEAPTVDSKLDKMVGTYLGMGDFSAGLSHMKSSSGVSCRVKISQERFGYQVWILNNEAQVDTYTSELGLLWDNVRRQSTQSDNGMTLRFDDAHNDVVTTLFINYDDKLFKAAVQDGNKLTGSSAVCSHLVKIN